MKCPPAPVRWRIAALLILTAVAVAPAVMLFDRVFGRDVVLIQAHDEAAVSRNRRVYTSGAAVETIYGTPLQPAIRAVSFTTAGLIRPPEDPSLQLFPVNRGAPAPVTMKSVFAVARGAIVVLLLVAALLLLAGSGSILRAEPIHPCREES